MYVAILLVVGAVVESFFPKGKLVGHGRLCVDVSAFLRTEICMIQDIALDWLESINDPLNFLYLAAKLAKRSQHANVRKTLFETLVASIRSGRSQSSKTDWNNTKKVKVNCNQIHCFSRESKEKKRARQGSKVRTPRPPQTYSAVCLSR